MQFERTPPLFIWSRLLLGIGLGGFFDGIILHQVLHWHHLLSSHPGYPADTVAGLRVNTLWDGIFHVLMYTATVAGFFLLWPVAHLPHPRWSTRGFIGLLLVGWGGFNVVEGVVNHQLLGIHHVNETAPTEQWIWWDAAFLVWGATMLVGG